MLALMAPAIPTAIVRLEAKVRMVEVPIYSPSCKKIRGHPGVLNARILGLGRIAGEVAHLMM